MSRVVTGVFTAVAPPGLYKEVQFEAVCFESDGVCDGGVGRVALTAATLQYLMPKQDVVPDNLTEGLPELPDAVGIDEGVDHRVSMRENDGYIHNPKGRTMALGAEQGKAVDDVQRQPADSKQPNNDGQRLGSLHLLLKSGARLFSPKGLQ